MDIDVQPGRYVVAVSGGVDSIALLYMLTKLPSVQIIIAHYDHGIRENSAEDRKHVQGLAKQLELPFVYDEGSLGKNTSEAVAREARYRFLRTVQKNSNARSIVTAHHQDDVIETALLNLLRGTGRKGLSSLKSTDGIVRPLLHVPKTHVIEYAKTNGLQWREDSTNTDTAYKRNYVRHRLVSKLTAEQRKQLVTYITNMHAINHEIDSHLANHLHMQPGVDVIDRSYFIKLSHGIAKEVLAIWLRRQGVRDFDAKGLERIAVAAKTYASGQTIDVNGAYYITVNGANLALKLRDR